MKQKAEQIPKTRNSDHLSESNSAIQKGKVATAPRNLGQGNDFKHGPKRYSAGKVYAAKYLTISKGLLLEACTNQREERKQFKSCINNHDLLIQIVSHMCILCQSF